jgi:Restriction endonuclease BglII
MNLRFGQYLHAETICRHDFPDEAESLLGVLESLTPPLYEVGKFSESTRPKTPKRQDREIAGGGKKAFLLPVNQTAMNAAIRRALRGEGWASEPVAAGPMAGPDTPLSLRGDFVRNHVFVEVEFGNTASMHRDFFKFQIASRSGAGDVGVLVTAAARFAKFFDSGVTTFEAAQRHRPYLAIGVQMPVWIIGMEPLDFSAIGHRYEEMRLLCEGNGLECHPFGVALGADIAVEEEPAPEGDISPDHMTS